MEVSVVISSVLLLVVAIQYKLLRTRSKNLKTAKRRTDEERGKQLEIADRLASASSFNTMEIIEIMQEQQ